MCHHEGTITHARGRRLIQLGTSDALTLTCAHCAMVATLDWEPAVEDPSQAETWRIRFRKLPRDYPYTYAATLFGKAGWLHADQALDMSAQVYIHRERLQQAQAGLLDWLKPRLLSPPPPLMSAEERVYLALKPVQYGKRGSGSPFQAGREGTVLDTGTFYLTDSKIHLLGQQRDRSHRLSEIAQASFDERGWTLVLEGNSTSANYYYGATTLGDLFDGELIVAIILALRDGAS
ncbi:MAG: hypothetical protein HC915_12100 [Anaerolineae bacterium]|nr:hypothetical protein [Anaerolineae bacterium]